MTNLLVIKLINSPNAILHKFGISLFEFLDAKLAEGERINLSFKGVKNVTSGFLNASFGNLYTKYGNDLDNLISLQGFDNSDWREKLKDAKLLALEPDKAKIMNDAIADLFV